MAGSEDFDVTYIVDDQDPGIEYLCSVGKKLFLAPTSPWYDNTYTTINSASCGRWFRHVFNGTGLSVNTYLNQDSPLESTDIFSVVIDEVRQDTSPSNRGKFTFDEMDDGEHVLVYSVGELALEPAFDYITIKAGQTTQLLGKSVVVDDSEDSLLDFRGSWADSPPSSLEYDSIKGPYMETGMWTNTPGDTMRFDFFGSEVSIYGLLSPNTASQSINVTYSIDGITHTTSSLPARASSAKEITSMSLLYSSGNLVPIGSHTLEMNITNVESPSDYVGVDFVVYQSGAVSVNEIRDFYTSRGEGPAEGSTRPGTTAIIAGVLGGVFFIALVALLLAALRRRRVRQRKERTVRNTAIFIRRLEGKNLNDFGHDTKTLRGDDVELGSKGDIMYLTPVVTKS